MIQVQLKLRPTKAQARTFDRWLWHLTGVWNWTIRTVEGSPARLSWFDLKRRLVGHSQKLGIHSSAIGGTAKTAHEAWWRYRAGLVGKPRLKGRSAGGPHRAPTERNARKDSRKCDALGGDGRDSHGFPTASTD